MFSVRKPLLGAFPWLLDTRSPYFLFDESEPESVEVAEHEEGDLMEMIFLNSSVSSCAIAEDTFYRVEGMLDWCPL